MTQALDRMIPPDETTPLRGSTFGDWEDQAAEVRRAVIPTLLEERAALEENALVQSGGLCPYCGSDRVYLKKEETPTELISPDGPIVTSRYRIDQENKRLYPHPGIVAEIPKAIAA